MRFTSRAVVCAIPAALFAFGCSKSSTEPEPPLVFPTGLYSLQSINAQALPYLYPGSNPPHTTVGGTFFFEGDDRWELVSRHCMVLPCEESVVQTQTVRGTYAVNGTTINFQETSPGALRFPGEFTRDGLRLTLDVDHPRLGKSLRVYTK